MRIWQLSLYGIAAAGISTAAAADIPAGTTETGGSVSRGDVQNVKYYVRRRIAKQRDLFLRSAGG